MDTNRSPSGSVLVQHRSPGDEQIVRSPRVLDARNVSKSFGATAALTDLSLHLRAGEVRALLGENGSGKSTFIKSMAGFHSWDTGEILVNGKSMTSGSAASAHSLGLRFVHQNLGLVASMPITDNMCLEEGYSTKLWTIRERRTSAKVAEDLARVGLFLDPATRVADLAPAERTGVAIARAIRSGDSVPPAVLVLDEPTATLPSGEVERLLAIVRDVAASGVAVIYVTHRLDEVFEIAHGVTILRDGCEILTQLVAALTPAAVIHHMVGAELEQVENHGTAARRVPARVPRLSVTGLHAGRLSDVSLSIDPGEIVGVAGLTGSGREDLAGAVFGAQTYQRGEVHVDGMRLPGGDPRAAMRSGIAYVPADRQARGGMMSLSARENLSITTPRAFWKWPWWRMGRERLNTQRWFTNLAIKPSGGTEKALETFSGGNQQKIVFAKWLQREPRVMVLEEPTQGVDVATKALLYLQLRAAAERGAAVLVISSDVEEVVAVCTRVLVLRKGRLVEELTGERITARQISLSCAGEHG